MKQISPKMLRQRKFLLVLPLLVIPFLTMAFWALGGGKNAGANNAADNAAGLNLELPGAALKDDKPLDKMGYYDRAANDSLKLLEQMKNDPYFTKNGTAADSVLDAITPNVADVPKAGTGKSYGSYNDPNEAKVYAKLGQLNAAMKESAGVSRKKDYGSLADYNPEVEKLEQLMAAGGSSGQAAPDPEIKQLNGMLEKILDIQHPDRVREALKKDLPVTATLAVWPSNAAASFSSLDTGNAKPGNGFFGLHDKMVAASANAIQAVVHQNQTLVSGAVVKMRLLADIVVDGHKIHKDNFVYGIVNLNRERLEVAVTSICDGESLFPVKMEVYDMDGLAGIYIPGAIGRDVAKQSGDNALQSLSLGTPDLSLGAQAASAGIETAKNLLSRKVKLVKVQVKAGYKILLKNYSN